MQEHTQPVLTIATANDYAKLPIELTHAGRFDERFFLDLPVQREREAIAAIHLRRFGCPDDGLASHIAKATPDWTGAEREQLVKSAARRSTRQPSTEDVALAASNIELLSQVRGDEIEKLRIWAHQSLRLANTPDEANPAAPSASSRRRRAQSGPGAEFGISLN